MAITKFLNYSPEPTALAFHNSTATAKCLVGPPGGGKTVAVLMDFLFAAMRQPADMNKKRRYHLGAIRSTFPKLKTTTKKTIEEWFPPEMGSVKETVPMTGLYTLPHITGDGTTVELSITLLAVDQEADLEKMKSQEFSGIWLHEGSELERYIFSMSNQRIGRFPPKKDGFECQEPMILIDTNTVDKDHWIYKLFKSSNPDDKLLRNIELEDGTEYTMAVELFEQPPAMICRNFAQANAGKEPPDLMVNAAADNLENLPVSYYPNQAASFSWDEIKSYLLMRWEGVTVGKLCHPEFDREVHVTEDRIEPRIGTTVLIGIDTSGLHPGAQFGQMYGTQLRVMDELYGEDVAFETFIESMLLPMLADRYTGADVVAICDPANPRDGRTGVTPVQLLKAHGIHAIAATTNVFNYRKEAVAKVFNRRNGCIISARCKMLVEGLDGKYIHRKLTGAGSNGDMYDTKPAKNRWSHPVEAFQYLCLEVMRVDKVEANRGDSRKLKKANKPRRII